MRYRHEIQNILDSTHFVTTVTRERGRWFTDSTVCREVLSLFEYYRAKFDLMCGAYVLMPDHFHALLLQTTAAGSPSRLMESFKRLSSRKIILPGYPAFTLWQDLYDDVPVPGTHAAWTKVHYAYNNAVKAGIVANAEDYLWSSARFYSGIRDADSTIVTVTPV
jgi:putative transposase